MDRRLLELYQVELAHLRGMGQEFRTKQTDVADRLGLDEYTCADPYVERLIESFAFLTARVQLQLDREFPRFTQNLLNLVYPGYLRPTPSMMVVQLVPDFGQPLARGHHIARGAELRVDAAAGQRCEFRTAHPVTLWPIELVDASYLGVVPRVLGAEGARGAVRLRLRARQPFSELAIDSLPLYLPEASDTAARLYEALLSSAVGLAARPLRGGVAVGDFVSVHQATQARPLTAPLGFDDDHALSLSDDPRPGTVRGQRRFQGFRLLQEYFAFPRRYMFVELRELAGACRVAGGADELELLVLLKWATPGMALGRSLEGAVTADSFKPYCTPAVNLFQKTADPLALRDATTDHLVVADPSRPQAYEVHQIAKVVGRLGRGGADVAFHPLYAFDHAQDGAYYTVERRPWQPPSGSTQRSTGNDYTGSDVYLTLGDASSGPVRRDLRHLDITLWCTNRGLPLTINRKSARFSCQSDRAVAHALGLSDPTRPRPAPMEGSTVWRLINHLALNQRSLLDEADDGGLPTLRRLLELYTQLDLGDHTVRRRVEGLHAARSSQVVRPLPGEPLAYGRGMRVEVTCDDGAYEETGAFLFASVLERFMARYSTINSFSETVLHTHGRGEVMRWPMRAGHRPLI